MRISRPINILLIEDETFDVSRVKRTLAPFVEKIIIKKVVADGQSAINAVAAEDDEFDVVIMDYQIAGTITGEVLIKKLKLVVF